MRLVPVLFLLLASPMMASADEPKKPVAALPPHPLDGAFEKSKTAKGLLESLGEDKEFKAALDEAVKAYKETAEKIDAIRKAGMSYAGPSPAQAARTAFLRKLLPPEEK